MPLIDGSEIDGFVVFVGGGCQVCFDLVACQA